jgi:hypothetical protein
MTIKQPRTTQINGTPQKTSTLEKEETAEGAGPYSSGLWQIPKHRKIGAGSAGNSNDCVNIPTGLHNSAQSCDEGATLGRSRKFSNNAEGVAASRERIGCNAFSVDAVVAAYPRVAPSSQPWAGAWNPFGIGF